MCKQTFKNMNDALPEESRCSSGQDCAERSSWVLSLKHVGGLEQGRTMKAFSGELTAKADQALAGAGA